MLHHILSSCIILAADPEDADAARGQVRVDRGAHEDGERA